MVIDYARCLFVVHHIKITSRNRIKLAGLWAPGQQQMGPNRMPDDIDCLPLFLIKFDVM